MQLPFFHFNEFDSFKKEVILNEDTSRHMVQVLRMKEGEKINLTDGNGNLIIAEITDAHKKHCAVKVIESSFKENNSRTISIGISLLKNSSRFEWFLEKVSEIGVFEIIPLICERTERQKFRHERMKDICISAMLQSQQCWLPKLHEPVLFGNLMSWKFESIQKMIAHCSESEKQHLNPQFISKSSNQLIVIGPEGDFTKTEIEIALDKEFTPVSLGDTRLRTETAGVLAVALLKNI